MKKYISVLIVLIISLTLLVIPAHAVSGSLSGSTSTPRPGDTITVTFRVDGQVTGFQGNLEYDSSVLTLQSVNSRCGGGWSFSQNGGSIVAYDTAATSPQTAGLFDAVFKVNSGVAVGTGISVGFSGKVTPADGSASSGVGPRYSASVAAPLSDDCDLSSLTVSNATLSPSFSPSTTNYSCGTVKFDVAKLNISATAHDNSASVAVNGANLAVGKNNVRVVVTAPSGKTKTYTIAVEREQDPNYVPNSETELSSLTVSEGKLSPEFAIKTREYVVYLPYEVDTISIKGETANDLIKEIKNIEDYKLKVGVNELKVEITAEDDSVGTYTVYVVRMDQFGGKDTVGVPASLLDKAAEPEVKDEEPAEVKAGVSPVVLAIAAVACLLLGFAIGAVVFRKKDKAVEPELEDEVLAETPETSEEAAPFKVDDNYLKYFDDPDKKE
ncbi:MAG: cadherin-like beta sandwich domain-containing protein [Oscillospiraceae bacterium]|nr:cadherin-like beta sandwich domain-containing protein [Candidatus Limimonas egerieequi]